jgi:hypothetical protein
MKKLWMGILSAVCAGSAMATVIFQDNFQNNSGALHNRRPDTFDSGVSALAYWKNEAVNFTVTNGVLQTTTNGVASAWLTMPTVSAGQVIKVSAVMVANGDVNTDYLSIGFSNAKNATYSAGNPWMSMYRRVDIQNGKGLLKVYSGEGATGSNLVNQALLTEAQGFTTNLNARNTVNYEYNTTTGNLLVWLLSASGTSVTQYNGSVNYGGVAGAIVPADQIKFMALTFNSVNMLGSANPAYLDNLTVEVIPEPATVGLFMVSGLGVLAIRRALR